MALETSLILQTVGNVTTLTTYVLGQYFVSHLVTW